MKSLLAGIESPVDLRQLNRSLLPKLAEELRQFILESVSKTGGHLASNLGVVELTIALHYVFNTPEDKIVWDVGHQTYVHKILTGRKNQMATIRKKNGLSGFPSRFESIYDVFGTAHSSTSLSAILGIALASRLRGGDNIHIAVIGDGAMSSGQFFEALNNIKFCGKAKILIILNDNGMSISSSVGSLNDYLNFLKVKSKKLIERTRLEENINFSNQEKTIFDEFGLKYLGPVDGHDLNLLILNLKQVFFLLENLDGPQLLHVVTQKGRGYKLAELNPIRYHGVGNFNVLDGYMPAISDKKTYGEIFVNCLCEEAETNKSIVVITPAMGEGSGLNKFYKKFPDRYFDVGIAEQHAVTFAGGLAIGGLRPVVAIYSTFLQRAYDQLIHDIAIQNLPVIFAIDRAGLSGPDGATHSGAFDIAFLRCIPNITIMLPSDENECRQMFKLAVDKIEGPVAIRYPRGLAPNGILMDSLCLTRIGKGKIKRFSGVLQKDKLHFLLSDQCWIDKCCEPFSKKCNDIFSLDSSGEERDKNLKTIAILAFGSMVHPCLIAGKTLDATVVDMRFVKPLDGLLLNALAKTHDIVVFVEEGIRFGGAGSACLEYFAMEKNVFCFCDFLLLGLPDNFVAHGGRDQLLSDYGLDSDGIVKAIRQRLLI